MPKDFNLEARTIMALARESSRMRDAAERVDLVVRALALRRGIEPERYETGETVSAIVK